MSDDAFIRQAVFNVTGFGVRPSVRLSVCPILIRRAAHTQRDSPGAARDVFNLIMTFAL